MSNRSLSELLPDVRVRVEHFIASALKEGLDLKVTATYRSDAEQDELYAQGRTKPGRIVTRARGGQSWHGVRRACDLVPLDNGNVRWDWPTEVWDKFGELAEGAGLEWGGRFVKFPDRPHVEWKNGMTLEEAHKALAGQPWPPVLQIEPVGNPETAPSSLPTDKLTPL